MNYDAAFWNQRYSGPEYIYGTAPNAFVAAMASRIPPGPVVCLAEGEGRNAVHLASLGHPVTAVDQSDTGLAKAARLAASRGLAIRTVTADLAHFPIHPGAWSGIVATYTHLPPSVRRSVFADAVRGLAVGGVFILEAYTPAQLRYDTGGPKEIDLLMTAAALREDLAGLQFEVLREFECDVVEGSGHTGRAAIVQVCAVRPALPA